MSVLEVVVEPSEPRMRIETLAWIITVICVVAVEELEERVGERTMLVGWKMSALKVWMNEPPRGVLSLGTAEPVGAAVARALNAWRLLGPEASLEGVLVRWVEGGGEWEVQVDSANHAFLTVRGLAAVEPEGFGVCDLDFVDGARFIADVGGFDETGVEGFAVVGSFAWLLE